MLNIGSNINEMRIDGSVRAFQSDLSSFQEFGLTAAEISIHGLDAIRNGRLDRHRAAEISSIMADFPFRYSAHAPNPLNLMDRHYRTLHRDVLHASLEFAAEAGIGVLVYHPGRFLVEEEFAVSGSINLKEGEQQQLLESEAMLLQEAADSFPGVTIAMENARPYLYHSPYCYAEFPARLKQQIERIDRSNVRMTLDFGHLNMASCFYNLNPVDEVRSCASLIAHCHVHDNFGNPVNYAEKNQMHQLPFGKGDSHMPVGWGNIPFDDLFPAFIDGYTGILICELRSRYFDATGESASALADILQKAGVGDWLAQSC
jgi:sugar phosphate isomerase/epimerase